MSTLKSTIARVTTRSRDPSPQPPTDESDPQAKSQADQYRLLVTAGPSYDTSTHQIVHVNSDRSTQVENSFLRAAIKVRIRGYKGLPSTCPSNSPYFDDPAHAKDQYSIAFSFIPKQDLPSRDTVWGNDFDHPVRDRLPPGFNVAFKIVKEFIDPGLECDAYADEPWLYGPSLSCWFAFRMGGLQTQGQDGAGDMNEKSQESTAAGKTTSPLPSSIPEKDDILREGADEDSDAAALRERLNIPSNNEKRRKFFLSASNRDNFVFEKDRLYSGDFYNPYLDFGNFALKLPGFSIKVIKYIDEKSHTLRYVFKNRATGDVYFCVNLNLLWGEELQKALKGDQEQVAALAGAAKEGEVDGSNK